MGIQFKEYESEDGWRWRLVSGNNKIMGGSQEAYDSHGNLNRALNALEMGLIHNLVDDAQLMVIRREHWQVALMRLQENFPLEGAVNEKIREFATLVEEAAI